MLVMPRGGGKVQHLRIAAFKEGPQHADGGPDQP